MRRSKDCVNSGMYLNGSHSRPGLSQELSFYPTLGDHRLTAKRRHSKLRNIASFIEVVDVFMLESPRSFQFADVWLVGK